MQRGEEALKSKGLGRTKRKRADTFTDAPELLLSSQWAAAKRLAVPEKLLLIATLAAGVHRATKPHNEGYCYRCHEWEWLLDKKQTMGEKEQYLPFRVVCDYLGVHPAWVLRKALEKASKPWGHPRYLKAWNFFLTKEHHREGVTWER